MKISEIHLKNYHQFKDLKIDLTYPKGHKKEGKPLDRVCLIGQSGTGKTTLLNLIEFACMPDGYHLFNQDKQNIMNFENGSVSFVIEYPDNGDFKYRKTILPKGAAAYGEVFDGGKEFKGIYTDRLKKINQVVLYFPVELMGTIKDFLNRLDDYTGSSEVVDSTPNIYDASEEGVQKYFAHFDVDTYPTFWIKLYENVVQYNKDRTNYTLQLSQKFRREHHKTSKDYDVELAKWEKANPNPLVIISQKVDDVLKNFWLKVKTEIDNVDEINTIQLISIKEQITIPLEGLSTGTKQVLFTMLPLFIIDPSDAIILMDEPETSLYPNIQELVVDYYTSFGKNNQHFFATHSPVIASAFDPWEIVELKFDEEGNIYLDNYLKDLTKGRHIDNYKFYPKYLRWDIVLTQIFDLDDEGQEERRKMLLKFAELKQMIEYKKEKEIPYEVEKREYEEIGEKIQWWRK